LWGVASVVVGATLFGNSLSDLNSLVAKSHDYTRRVSFIVDYFSTDWPPGGFKLLFLPHPLGMDMLVWTVGLGVWLFAHQGLPWLALGHLLGPYPAIAATAVVVFNMLAGALLMTVPALLLRGLMWLGDLSNRPPGRKPNV